MGRPTAFCARHAGSGSAPDAGSRAPVDEPTAGFAAVDALVALTILTSTIALTLGATQVARRAATSALETRRADDLLQYVLLSSPRRVGSLTGQAEGFDWRLETQISAISAGAAAPPICTRAAEARASRSGRRYHLATAEICAPDERTAAAA